MNNITSPAEHRRATAPVADLSLDDVLSRVWVFASPTKVLAKQVRLLPDGRISGYHHKNEHSWSFAAGRVSFRDFADRMTTGFDTVTSDAEGRLAMAGSAIGQPGVTLTLTETVPYQTLAPDFAGFPIDVRVPGVMPGEGRRNLVLLFANERSLHHQWPRSISSATRSWDLGVSFYGPAAEYRDLGIADFSSLQTGVRKCRALHAAFGRGSPLWNYDRVWIADDDLVIDWADINALFNIAANYGLAIAQPSLKAGSEVAHEITRQVPGRVLRYTSFVEAMAPMFTRDALELCVPVFDRQVLGWGIDFVWPRLIGPPHGKMAIIDAVSMLHTRPSASGYSRDAAEAEQNALLDAYGVTPGMQEFGGV